MYRLNVGQCGHFTLQSLVGNGDAVQPTCYIGVLDPDKVLGWDV